jgi:phosphoglycerate kinase
LARIVPPSGSFRKYSNITAREEQTMKKTVRDADVSGKRVLVRVDFNVPLDKNGAIEDDTRIRACLPTIRYLIEHHARVILCSHLDRPDGRVVEGLRLAPVAVRLSTFIGRSVLAMKECTGPDVETAVSSLGDGDVMLLENIRFHTEEERNDPEFSKALARLADIYVNDAFGASHRRHASVVGITNYLPSFAGLLMERELAVLGGLLENPRHPFAAIVGGSKVSGKLGILENIMKKVDTLIIGGGIAATFLAARGYNVGTSPVERERLDYVAGLARKAESAGIRILLPCDVVVAERADGNAGMRTVPVTDIREYESIVDIGPETIELFARELRNCRTVIWNGPMGIFEIPAYSSGTRAIASALAELDAVTVVGGGSTAEIVTAMGLADRISHVSTGGGASLQFLAGEILPGVAALPDR